MPSVIFYIENHILRRKKTLSFHFINSCKFVAFVDVDKWHSQSDMEIVGKKRNSLYTGVYSKFLSSSRVCGTLNSL